MTDREFLIWIHERLINFGENNLYDYMHRLRDIIYSLPRNQHTTNKVAMNDLNDLRKELEKKDE